MGQITKIMDRAKALFPAHDYGYGSWLRHDGMSIKAIDASRPGELHLSSQTPRRFENGRYYPGWDCVESSRYIKKELDTVGIASSYVELENPVYPHDMAVLAGGAEAPLTITPGLNIIAEDIKSGRISFREIPEAVADLRFNLHRMADQIVSDTFITLGFDESEGFGFLSHAGMLVSERSLGFMFITHLINTNMTVNKLMSVASIPLDRVRSAQNVLSGGDEGATLKHFKTDVVPDMSNTTAWTRPAYDLTIRVNARRHSRTLLEMLRVLDPGWIAGLNAH